MAFSFEKVGFSLWIALYHLQPPSFSFFSPFFLSFPSLLSISIYLLLRLLSLCYLGQPPTRGLKPSACLSLSSAFWNWMSQHRGPWQVCSSRGLTAAGSWEVWLFDRTQECVATESRSYRENNSFKALSSYNFWIQEGWDMSLLSSRTMFVLGVSLCWGWESSKNLQTPGRWCPS